MERLKMLKREQRIIAGFFCICAFLFLILAILIAPIETYGKALILGCLFFVASAVYVFAVEEGESKT